MPAVAISWTPSTDTDITTYYIGCATTTGAPGYELSHYDYDGSAVDCDVSPKDVGLVSFASFTVPDDSNTYYFAVFAYNGSEYSAASDEVTYPIGTGTTAGKIFFTVG